ncbi:MAG: hypothetical protein Q9208_003425 [Pyrenodesmia sp. 3 TL-2023]
MATRSESLNKTVIAHWDILHEKIKIENPTPSTLNGHNLDVATIVAVASAIDASARALQAGINDGEVIYGINTGFGGSANTRTKAADSLKKDLLRGLRYGISLESRIAPIQPSQGVDEDPQAAINLPLDHAIKAVMPEAWVRASMVVRANSLAYGASGVRYSTIVALLTLLEKDIIPIVPLRGSISASGDLSPLAYIASVLEGKPSSSVYTRVSPNPPRQHRIQRADEALAEHSIKPLALDPREALALVNGTSVSAAVAALASHEALLLASLAQILTAMSVEGLLGTDESFHPFFAHVRPHGGQAECASNILSALSGSSLLVRSHSFASASLRQDRYSIRTAAQWIGPCIEDLLLAHKQITTELNSATDNPLISSASASSSTTSTTGGPRAKILHGGNFQAQSLTSATAKIRHAAQPLGRLLFAQCTELINPATSRGLAPNLVAAEPSASFLFKGIDILVAALLSELGFLAAPVSPHVQTAEMGNQAVNSLALLSARYTLDALDVLAQLAAAHAVAVCQALDLRALWRGFVGRLRGVFEGLFEELIASRGHLMMMMETASAATAVQEKCWLALLDRLDATTSVDSGPRFEGAVLAVRALLLDAVAETVEAFAAVKSFARDLEARAVRLYRAVRDEYVHDGGSAEEFLGKGSRKMYVYVRRELGVPFLGPDTLATPGAGSEDGGFTVGDMVGKVRGSMMGRGGLYGVVVECLREFEEGVVGEGRKERERL